MQAPADQIFQTFSLPPVPLLGFHCVRRGAWVRKCRGPARGKNLERFLGRQGDYFLGQPVEITIAAKSHSAITTRNAITTAKAIKTLASQNELGRLSFSGVLPACCGDS